MSNREWKSDLIPIMDRQKLVDAYYLDIRSALLESAAFFDRLDRADGTVSTGGDECISRLKEMCRMIAAEQPDRVPRILDYLSVKEDI